MEASNSQHFEWYQIVLLGDIPNEECEYASKQFTGAYNKQYTC